MRLGPRRFLAHLLLALVLCSVGAHACWKALGRPATGIDDADITLVYARHFSDGHGLVYNIGGERVEGFSSVSWMSLAAFFSLWTEQPELPLIVASILALSVGLASLSCLLVGARSLFSAESAAFLLWALGAPAFLSWTTISIMETGLWSALLLTGAALLVYRPEAVRAAALRTRFLSGVLAIMVLTRPEGFVVAGLYAVIHLVDLAGGRREHRASLTTAALPLLTVVVVTAVATVFRLAYFGYPLPNTYYAKVGADTVYELTEGAKYLVGFLTANPSAILCLVGTIAVLLHGAWRWATRGRSAKSARESARLMAAGIACIAFVVPVLLGGDHFDGYRFYQPFWPLLILPVLLLLPQSPATADARSEAQSETPRNGRRIAIGFGRWAGVAALAASSVLGAESDWKTARKQDFRREFAIARQGRSVGETLTRLFASSNLPSVGVITAGGIKHSYAGDVIDLMGMNYTPIAHAGRSRVGDRGHAAFDKAVFYAAAPAVVVIDVARRDAVHWLYPPQSFENVTLKGLLWDEEFRRTYSPARVERTNDEATTPLAALYRNDFLQQLGQTGDFEVFPLGNDR